MLMAYINYPETHIEIHRDPTCGSIQKHKKENQRLVSINHQSFAAEVGNFVDKKYAFASNAAKNDMWLSVDFDDPDFEKNVICYLIRILSVTYSPFKDCPIHEHPCS